MTTLSKNWITEKHIDFEYKQYMLLAYLKEVNDFFGEIKLYPKLSEIIDHHKQLMLIRENREQLIASFPKRIKQIDLNTFKIEYENTINDDVTMKEIENIVNYSVLQFEHSIFEGKKIFDFIEKHLTISPIGLETIYAKDNGYLLLKNGNSNEIKTYEYELKLFEQSDVMYKAIHVHYLDSYEESISTSMQAVKTDLIRKNKTQATPTTYAIATDLTLPYEETFLPIAKRYLVKHIS